MRMTQLFAQTLREVPVEAEAPSHQLLLRAGYIRQLAAGVFSYLPLGRRALDKVERIIRQEIEAIGGQEISMPVVHPADLWKETGRWYSIDAEMGRFNDRAGRELVLGMTHEEVVADLVRKEVRSYRQLPRLLYQIQTKWRDDPRPRAGLIRAREFTMKDSYSLDAGWEGLDRQYRAHYQAYFNIFHRCGLPVIAVKSDVGMMGGQLAHEFMFLNPVGEDTLMLCETCGYSANRQVASFTKPEAAIEDQKALQKVATPECKSIEALAEFLGVPRSRTAKAVFLVAEMAGETPVVRGETPPEAAQAFIFVVVRGDMEVNETKLANLVKARALRPATEEEIQAVGAAPGYASPVGLTASSGKRDALPVKIIVDDLVPRSPNLVAGANEPGYHLLNVNYGRDYTAHLVADIAAAQEGDACPQCSSPLHAVRGVEVGNIFQLGTRYSQALGAEFLDRDGQSRPVIMGSYGIGTGRLLACIAEQYHDEAGLAWPVSVAPFAVHLVALFGKKSSAESGSAGSDDSNLSIANSIYAALWQAGVQVLMDDREETPGVKFKDADLIGLPLRLTVSERALVAGGIEFKRRDRSEREVVPLTEVVSRVQTEIAALQAEINQRVVKVPYTP
jgi:prolyl-tRNA synthetase